MGWFWRATTGTEWDEALPALRMYWQSHRKLVTRLLWLLALMTLIAIAIGRLQLPLLPNPTGEPEWSGESGQHVIRVWPFVVFLAACFLVLPPLPTAPVQLSKSLLLPQRLFTLAFSLASGLCCSLYLAVLHWMEWLSFEYFDWQVLSKIALAGHAPLLVPIIWLIGIQHTAISLTRITRACLVLWIMATLAAEWITWDPLFLGSPWAGFTPQVYLALLWALPVTILICMVPPRLRAAGFILSMIAFLVVSIFSVQLQRVVGDYSVAFIHSGVAGLGRLDRTYSFIIGVIQ